MALSIVQAKKGEASTGATATVSITTTAGNLLVIKVCQFSGTLTGGSCTDNGGTPNTYTKIVATTATSGGSGIICYYAKNIQGGTYTITFNASGTANGVVGIVHEVSGADTVAPFTSGEDAVNSGSSTTPTTGSVTNSVANSIYFAGVTNDDSANPVTLTPASPFSTFDSTNSQELNAASFPDINVSNDIVSTSAARTTSWTAANQSWVNELDDFKIAPVAGFIPKIDYLTQPSLAT